jgi:hypothetical protein
MDDMSKRKFGRQKLVQKNTVTAKQKFEMRYWGILKQWELQNCGFYDIYWVLKD